MYRPISTSHIKNCFQDMHLKSLPPLSSPPSFQQTIKCLQLRILVGRHSKKLVTIVYFMIKAQNLVYVLKKSL